MAVNYQGLQGLIRRLPGFGGASLPPYSAPSYSGPSQSGRFLSSWTIGILVLPTLTVAAILTIALSRSYDRNLSEASSLSENLAWMAMQQTERTVSSVDSMLTAVNVLIDPVTDRSALSSRHLREQLDGLLAHETGVERLIIKDDQGVDLNGSSGQSVPLDADFAASALKDPQSRLFIGHPFETGTPRHWCVPVARSVKTADGKRLLLVAEVSVGAFAHALDSASISKGAAIIVTMADGYVLAANPDGQNLVGSSVPGWQDTTPHLVTERRVGDYPLAVSVHVRLRSVLNRWWKELRIYVAIVGMSILGSLAFAVGMLRSARRRIRAEALADKNKLQLRRAIEAMSDGFLLCDSADRLVIWNSSYLKLFPFLEPILKPGMTFRELVEHVADHAPLSLDEASREHWIKWRMERHAGGLAPFEQEMTYNMCYQATDKQTPEGETVTIVSDVTARRSNERMLQQSKEMAEEANRAKSAFLANMSHELRTPLNAIIGFAQLLKLGLAGPLTPKQREYLDDVHRSGDLLHALLTDLLDTARIDAGKLVLDEQSVDVRAALAECLRLVEAQAVAGNVTLDLVPGTETLRLLADALRLRQMVLNLLTNAVKFTPAGGRVSVSVQLEEEGGAQIVVTDTGIGIAAEDLPQVMAPFGQVSSVLSRAHHGVGLGLPLTKQLVESHGGRLTIASTPSKGTTVTLHFPPSRVAPREKAIRAA